MRAVGAAGTPGPDDAVLDEHDAVYLRRAITLSALAAQRGSRPFGAVVVGADGEVLAEACNDTARGDCAAHSEIEALRSASGAHPREALAAATIYASGEPCVMCAGGIYWAGIRRVVFGIDAVALRDFRRLLPGTADLELSCREVFAASPQPIEVVGPAPSEEAAAAHRTFWRA